MEPELVTVAKPKPILLPEEEDIKKELKDLLFEFYKELKNLKNNNLTKINEILKQIDSLKEKYRDNKEVLNEIEVISNKMNSKLIEIVNTPNSEIDENLIRQLSTIINSSKALINIDLKNIDIEKILKQYEMLNNCYEKGNLKEITSTRGRLIRILKSEKNNINKEYNKITVLIEISKVLEKGCTIEQIKNILTKPENKHLYFYFEDNLTDINTFTNAFNNVMNDNSIKQIIFLEEALRKELAKQKAALDERYSKEFLDQKGTIPSLVTVLPNAVGIAVNRLATTISEIKEAKTNRRKTAAIGEVLKETFSVLATPIIYAGKFAINNWYTLYMAYKGISNTKAEEERKAKEQAERQEAARKAYEERKAEAEAKAKEQAERQEAAHKAVEERKSEKERLASEHRQQEMQEAARQLEEQQQTKAEIKPEQQTKEELTEIEQQQTKVEPKPEEQLATKQEEATSEVPDPIITEDKYNQNLFDTKLIACLDGLVVRGAEIRNVSDYQKYIQNPSREIIAIYRPMDSKLWEYWKWRTIRMPLDQLYSIWPQIEVTTTEEIIDYLNYYYL